MNIILPAKCYKICLVTLSGEYKSAFLCDSVYYKINEMTCPPINAAPYLFAFSNYSDAYSYLEIISGFINYALFEAEGYENVELPALDKYDVHIDNLPKGTVLFKQIKLTRRIK